MSMYAPEEFKGRTVIITGAGQGLGRAYAMAFARLGASVVAADIAGGNAHAVAREIEKTGGVAMAVPLDITDKAAVETMVADVMARFGRIDVLVNNAAIATALSRQGFCDIDMAEWYRVLDVNVTGSYLCARAVTPHLKAAGYGRIINVSSTTVVMGRVDMLHYVASKAAVIGMTRSMARELGPTGITVNVILPGLTPHEVASNGLTPAGLQFIKSIQCIPRVETPDDMVASVLFLASEGSRFITGQSLAVDGGAIHV